MRCWAEPIADSEIEREELPPMKQEELKIPETNIPDRGESEGLVPPRRIGGDKDQWRLNDPEIEVGPFGRGKGKIPSQTIDPGSIIPANNYRGKRKEWDS